MGHPREEERPAWEISNIGLMMFTSLMIILLAFFIMLSSIAVIDEQRQIEAMGSVLGAFGLLPGGMGVSETSHQIAPQSSPMDNIEDAATLIRDVLSTQITAGQVHFFKGRTRRIISLESAIMFPPDGAELLPAMRPLLLEIAGILKEDDFEIVVEGHTDDQPPMTEAFENNWQISTRRAVNVLRFLADEGGISPTRLTAYGYAGNKPQVANISPRHRARNNRIDLVLDPGQARAAKGYKRRHSGPKLFDFKGFYFKITGGDRE